MRKSLILLTALVSLFYYSKSAQAGFLLEPFAGLHVNSTSEISNTSYDLSGNAVGARVGFQNMGLMLGLDYRNSTWNFKPKTGSSSDYKMTTMGFFVGYDFPIMLRLWGNYVFSHSGENVDTKSKVTNGSGTVLGIGYKVIPFVSLNFEIGNYKTDKTEDAAGTEYNTKATYTTYLMSVSFPISI